MAAIATYQQEAEARYHTRRPEREQRLEAIRKKGVEAVDDPQRLAARKNRLDRNDGLAWERIIGRSDLLDINYLDIGRKASRAVCRLQVRDETGRILGFGTGFLISSSLLMTNNHVLDKLENCRRSLADFNFEDDENFMPRDTKTFSLDPDRFFHTNEKLDFTIVAVRPTASDGTNLAQFGYLPLHEETGKALVDEYVTIIQHPDGGNKQITLRENHVVDVFDEFVHYETDTMPGSSGSPVFNDQWEIVALHHAGVRAKDARGHVKHAKPAASTSASTSGDNAEWVANEGIRVSSICHDLRALAQNLPVDRRSLLNEALAAAPSSAPAPAAPKAPEVVTQRLEWYLNAKGYDPKFLGKSVPLPTLPADLNTDRVPLRNGSGHELTYTHFSIVMSKNRRLAFFTAVNLNGAELQDIQRTRDKWYFDPRIEEEFQCGPDLYDRNDLDRGHLVRRLDPTWGSAAKQANEDTFHFTNCSPQHKNLNQHTWQGLEDYILKNAGKHDLKVVVFTGPVFRDDDMLYRGEFQIPAEFWKVVVIKGDEGKLSATAYLQTQKNLIEDLEFAYGGYKTYQVQVSRIESLTRLDFGTLHDHDPLAAIEGVIGREITAPEDIRL